MTALQPARPKLLVVDDEPLVGRSVKMMLANRYEVRTVTGVDDALVAIGAEVPDLILCDLMMPGVTGMDLHAELAKTRPELARRMVFMTGGAFTARAHLFLEETSNQVVEKPFESASLLAALTRTLPAA